VVAAAGNMSHAEVVEMAQAKLRDLPVGPRAPRELLEPVSERRVVVAPKELEQAHICWGTLAVSASDPDRYAMDLLNAVFGGSMASRLFREIREKRGLVYAVHSYLSLHVDAGALTVYAGTRPDNTEQVIRLIGEEADKLIASGITAEELERAQSAVEGALVLGLENTNRRMMRIGGAETSSLELLSVDEVMDRYQAVTLDDIVRVAQRTLAGPTTLAVVGPHEQADIEALLP
jgi:predicted Zn-dependent peptidase